MSFVRILTAPLTVASALLACGCGPGSPSTTGAPQSGSPSADLVPVFTAQLERSAADWNRGNLDGFMSDYAADSLTGFVSEGRVRRGYPWIREHYAPLFQPGAVRDSLRFERVEVRSLGPEFALVTARFVLHRGGTTTASGPFTLVFQRRPDGWKILHDHTSSDPR